MSNGILERAAVDARRSKAITKNHLRMVLKRHGLAQTPQAIEQLDAEIIQQSTPYFHGFSYSRNAFKIPPGCTRRDVARFVKTYVGNGRFQFFLEERLENFRITAFGKLFRKLMESVANRIINISSGDIPMAKHSRMYDGIYSSRCTYTKFANAYDIVIPKHWRSRVLSRGLAKVVDNKLIVDAYEIPGYENVYDAVWITRVNKCGVELCRGTVLAFEGHLVFGKNVDDCYNKLRKYSAEVKD